MASTTLIEGKDGKMYSDAFLAEIRELNQTLFKTVRATLERTPFADCRQTLKDYIRLYEETEARYDLKHPSTVQSGSKRVGDSDDGGVPAKNVKFANGAATVVIKEEDEDEVKSGDVEKEKVGLTAQFQFNRPDAPQFNKSDASSVSGAATNSSLHRATGTSSLLAPLPLAFHFKPVSPVPGDSSTNGGSTGALPLINLFPPQQSVDAARSTAPAPAAASTTASKLPFSLPTSVTTSTSTASSQAMPPFAFSFTGGPFPTATSTASSTTITGAAAVSDEQGGDEGAEGEEETPPEPEAVEVREDGAIYKKPCQLFFRPLGDKTMHEKGTGVLFLKRLETGVQLLVRASNVLKTVLLNVMLVEKLPMSLHGKQSVRLVCAPNPPLASSSEKGKPSLAEFFFKCDSSGDAQELFDRLQKERQGENKT